MSIRTRFAPSPTGFLHLGHVYSASQCRRVAGSEGECLLRFEDIDYTRVRPEYYQAIIDDLRWLGISFLDAPWRQLDRMQHYEKALKVLIQKGVAYPCFCTRKDLAAEQNLSAPHGSLGAHYSGKCRVLTERARAELMQSGKAYSWRLNSRKALDDVGPITFYDKLRGMSDVQSDVLGDVIIARKDIQTSYHIAVVVDDEAQGVTHVVRGEDLFESTHVHRLLQALWGYKSPIYHHHSLMCDANGKRLAKRHDSLSVRELREQGMTPAEVLSLVDRLTV